MTITDNKDTFPIHVPINKGWLMFIKKICVHFSQFFLFINLTCCSVFSRNFIILIGITVHENAQKNWHA